MEITLKEVITKESFYNLVLNPLDIDSIFEEKVACSFHSYLLYSIKIT